MESERLKTKIHYAIATSIYLNPDGGFHGYDDATDKVMKIVQEYASLKVAEKLKPLQELEKELNELGPNWNLFGKVDRMKALIKAALKP